MPITNTLGEDIKRKLSNKVKIDFRTDQTFEAWLTSMMDDMPFLSPSEVLARKSEAALVTQTIAEILDAHQSTATQTYAPDWLLQLVRLWHAERAVVITFNYDCLVERAINTARLPVGYTREYVETLRGMDVVSPAPPRREITYLDDGDTNLAFESMTLVKLHGSLNWYRAGGDEFGSTLLQDFDHRTFGGVVNYRPRGNPELLAQMDRFIIPPTSDKTNHYGAYLVPALWKTARKAISAASRITFMGYSLPPEDRVSVELMTHAPNGVRTIIADRTSFDPADDWGLPSRLRNLGLNVVQEVDGEEAIPKVVSRMLLASQLQISAGISSDTPSPAYDCYVVWSDDHGAVDGQLEAFRLFISDEADPTLLRAVPFKGQEILSNPEAFQDYVDMQCLELGIDAAKLIREQELRRLTNLGIGLRVQPENETSIRSVVGFQHAVSPNNSGGELIALHTVEGDLPRPLPGGRGFKAEEVSPR